MQYVDGIEKAMKKWDRLFSHNKNLHFIEPEARPYTFN